VGIYLLSASRVQVPEKHDICGSWGSGSTMLDINFNLSLNKMPVPSLNMKNM
jgi:hypothetical protein